MGRPDGALPAAAPPEPVTAVHLRPWHVEDVDDMVRLFDTEQMDRWTPLTSPFTRAVAEDYVARAHQAADTLQLAVCDSPEGPPLGEVIVFPGEPEGTVELAYAVGAEHQGRGVATGAVLLALDLARTRGAKRAALTIAVGNKASEGVARATGFQLTEAPLVRRERKGYVLEMRTWTRAL